MQPIATDLDRLKAKLEEARQKLRDKHGGKLPSEIEENAPVCRHCKGAGWLSLPYDPSKNTDQEIAPCTRCPQDVQQQRMMRVAKRVGMEGYEQITFESLRPLPGQEAIWQDCIDYAMAPDGWLLLIGEPYRGKTLMSLCIANEWLQSGKAVIHRGTVTLMDELRDASIQDGRLGALREVFMHTPCLVLDDFARERPTPFVDEQMFSLTDYRLERRLPTVVTCNLTMHELERRNERLWSRLADTTRCTVIQFDNPRIER